MANLEHRGYLPLKASPDFNSSFPLSGEESYLLTFAISHRGSKIIGFVLTFVHLSEARGGRGGEVKIDCLLGLPKSLERMYLELSSLYIKRRPLPHVSIMPVRKRTCIGGSCLGIGGGRLL